MNILRLQAANWAMTPKFLDRVRHTLRLRHYSVRTEEDYIAWKNYSGIGT